MKQTPRSSNQRAKDRMRRNRWSGPDAPPLVVRGHHLLCAVCARGGCRTPPPGPRCINRLLKAMWTYPHVQLKVCADVDVVRAHYRDVYGDGNRKRLPPGFAKRSDDYIWRRKDLEVCRVLGILPNTEIPAFFAYTILFQRQPTLDGICRTGSKRSRAWPECPHAKRRYYEKIAAGRVYNLAEQTLRGETMDGQGVWAMVRARSREDMQQAKARSATFIMEKAERLYMRPQHLLCLLCRPTRDEVLVEDNLIEMMRRMEQDPAIPVTLVEGCCQACYPCNEYHAGEHLCGHAHAKDALRDLMILERLGLPPGATLPARELYRRVYARIDTLKEICGWRDGSDTALYWAPCGYDNPYLDNARREGFLTGAGRPKDATH